MKNENRLYFARCKAIKPNGERCTTVMESRDMIKVAYLRNANYYYVCPECGETLYSYYDENCITKNKQANHGFTFSMEHEMTSTNEDFINHLKAFGYLATFDCTVALELKSPIYCSLSGFCKTHTSVDEVLKYSDLMDKFFADNAGTHCNIGHVDRINEDTISMLKKYYQELFYNLGQLLANNPEPTAKVFGRELNGWCKPINAYTEPDEHENFINLQHDTHIEFRFTKYRDARQYTDAVKVCRDLADKLITHFIEYYEYPLEKIDTTRYKSQSEFRLKKAQTCNNQLIKVVGKAFKSVGYDIDLKPYLNKLY